jgi:TRAP transporter 4TM/12TM fusion protein
MAKNGDTNRRAHTERDESLIVSVLAIALSLISIIYVSNFLKIFDIHLIQLPYLSLMLAILLALVLLKYSFNGKVRISRPPVYDILLIILGVAGPLYNFIFWEKQLTRMSFLEFYHFEYVFAFLTVIVTLEATRRVLGNAMTLIATFFVVHAVFSGNFPGFLYVGSPSLSRVVTTLVYSSQGIYGIAFNTAAVVVVVFTIFGQFLLVSGAGKFFNEMSMALFGRFRGGPAKMAVASSAVFGTLTGATTANIATTGAITIPLMKSLGYKKEFAAAVEAVASNGGQIVPPVMGVVAFIMAEWLGMPYWDVCLAAIIPAILYFLAIFVMVDSEAVHQNLKGLPSSQCPAAWKTLKGGWYYIFPILALIYMIGALRYSPEYSGLNALAILLVLCLIITTVEFVKAGERFGLDTVRSIAGFLIKGLSKGAIGVLPALMACATAGLVIGSLDLSQLGLKLSHGIVFLAGNSQFLLLVLAAACCYLLGIGMTSIPAYMMVVILVAPALQKFGIEPLISHMFVFYWAIASFITPPIALGAYVAAAIAEAQPMKTGFIAMRLGIVLYIVPFLFVYKPQLLLIGTGSDILVTTILSIAAVVLLSYGISRNLLVKLDWKESLLLILAGAALCQESLYAILIAVVLSGMTFFLQVKKVRRLRQKTSVI